MRGRRPGRDSLFRQFHNRYPLWPYYDPHEGREPPPPLKRKFDQRYLPPNHAAEIQLRSANDSRVLGIDLGTSDPVVTLNDYDGWRLANALEDNPAWHRDRPELPVELHFKGLRECFVYVTRERCELRRLSHARDAALTKTTEFYAAMLLSLEEGRIAMILSFMRTDLSSDLIIAVDAESLGWSSARGMPGWGTLEKIASHFSINSRRIASKCLLLGRAISTSTSRIVRDSWDRESRDTNSVLRCEPSSAASSQLGRHCPYRRSQSSKKVPIPSGEGCFAVK